MLRYLRRPQAWLIMYILRCKLQRRIQNIALEISNVGKKETIKHYQQAIFCMVTVSVSYPV